MKKITTIVLLFLWGAVGYSQQIDTTGIYGERKDSLDAAVFTERNPSNYLSKGREIRTEIISADGLMKMACCNLGESFENSASVTVGYSDATTGARQIRLLGLSGAYTQMLDENRPAMRGIAAPFGLSYVPGPWMESIQVAKGSPSLVNGSEAVTGSINMEFRKPTDSKPLYVQASVMDDTKTDVNILSSLDLGKGFYTIIMGHADGNFRTYDMNGDGFADDPRMAQFNLSNRWLYYTPELQLRWGVKALRDSRKGGQIEGPWTSDVTNSSVNAYFKAGKALREDNSASIALVGDYSWHQTESFFGHNAYTGGQHSAFGNLIYRNLFTEHSDLTAGLHVTADLILEDILAGGQDIREARTTLTKWEPYAEYTFKQGESFTLIAGLSLPWVVGDRIHAVPRLTAKYQPSESWVFRLNGGRGLRHSHPIADHIGILSTGKRIEGALTDRLLEDAWTYGGNATVYFTESAYLSLDWFSTSFSKQLLTDRESPSSISFYTLDGHRSYSNNLQADMHFEPLAGLELTLTGRMTDARAWQPGGEVRELPMTSSYKAVFNAQYKTKLSRWIFDFTAAVNGPSRVYDFMREIRDADGTLLYPDGMTPAFPSVFAQVTRRFRGFDIFLGGENLTGYTQPVPVIDAATPFSETFDAASVWGPLMGAKVYAGFRITIWK